jgi:hypothetical protein
MPGRNEPIADNVKLLHSPYKAPRLKRGDRAQCLYKDCLVEIKNWSEARIAWPRIHRTETVPVPTGGCRAYLTPSRRQLAAIEPGSYS